MAGSASISGLASGLDTATIISQLMQLEAMPQNRLRTQVSTHETAVKSMQNLNTKLAALVTKAEELAKPAAWSSVKAVSSSDQVSVTTSAGAAATALSFTVEQTARNHQLSFHDLSSLSQVVTSGAVVLDRLDGSDPVTITLADTSLQGLVDGINAAGEGLRATTVRVADGSYRLRVESTATGADSDFTLTDAVDGPILGGATATAGRDAAIVLGLDRITSAGNTFAGLLPGVDVTLGAGAKPETQVDLTLSTDSKAMSDKVKGLVDALNGVLSDIDAATKAGGSGVKAGPLAGDSNLRSVRDQLVNTLYTTTGGSLVGAGIQLDKYGRFTFDEAAFTKAYETDPVTTAALFTKDPDATGFADRVAKAGDAASDAYDGTLSLAIKGRNTTIERLNDSIDSWDLRLELRRTTLTRQFTSLETALSQMNSQSGWLAGQLASLNRSTS